MKKKENDWNALPPPR